VLTEQPGKGSSIMYIRLVVTGGDCWVAVLIGVNGSRRSDNGVLGAK